MEDALARSLEALPVLLNEGWDKATQRLHTTKDQED
jgi:hypothetical protein